MTRVNTQWLDRIVTARTRLGEARTHIGVIVRLQTAADYNDTVDWALTRDGTRHRVDALRARMIQLEEELDNAQRHGSDVGSVLLGLTELIDTAATTEADTQILVDEALTAPPPEDPFADRLEEHPSYERS